MTDEDAMLIRQQIAEVTGLVSEVRGLVAAAKGLVGDVTVMIAPPKQPLRKAEVLTLVRNKET